MNGDLTKLSQERLTQPKETNSRNDKFNNKRQIRPSPRMGNFGVELRLFTSCFHCFTGGGDDTPNHFSLFSLLRWVGSSRRCIFSFGNEDYIESKPRK